jgi:hypothetical protein
LVIATIMPISTKKTMATCIHIHVRGIPSDSLPARATREPTFVLARATIV